MAACRDKAGTSILVGDFIIYGHALGRCAGLRYGRVLRVVERLGTACTQAGYSLTVIGVNDDNAPHRPAHLLPRESTLLYPESRVLVLDGWQVPEPIRAMLFTHPCEAKS